MDVPPFPARPKGAPKMHTSGVAVLDEDLGHCLRTASWLCAFGALITTMQAAQPRVSGS